MTYLAKPQLLRPDTPKNALGYTKKLKQECPKTAPSPACQWTFFKALFANAVVKHGFPWPMPAIERVSDQVLIHGPSSETIRDSLRDSGWRRH